MHPILSNGAVTYLPDKQNRTKQRNELTYVKEPFSVVMHLEGTGKA